MQSSRFPIVTAIITVLLSALLVLVVVLTLRTSHPAAVIPASQSLSMPTSSPDDDRAVASALGDDALSASDSGTESVPPAADLQPAAVTLGGFSYVPPAGFTVSAGETSATLTGRAAAGELAPIFLLSGGPSAQFVAEPSTSLDEMFDRFVTFFAEEDDFSVGDVETLIVDGAPARAVPLLGQESMDPFAGRIVMAQPAPDRLFVMTGVARAVDWEAGAAALYADVLASVRLIGDDPPATGATLSSGQLLVPTRTASSTPTPTATPTAIPTSQPLPTPDPAGAAPDLPTSYANANAVRELAVTGSAIWAATDGGIVAWNRSGGLVTFTSQKGLALNHFNSAVYCPLPGLGIVFGTDGGLQIFDARNGTWNMLTSANSAMSFDDVSTVRCNEEDGFLTVGYSSHGIDFYDTSTNRWTHLDRNDGLASDAVDHVAVVGDRVEIWAASGFGVSVLQDGRARNYAVGNSPLTSNQINMLAVAPDDAVWIVAPDALHRVRGQQWTTYNAASAGIPNFPAAALTAVTFESEDVLWVGSAAGEICRFDADAGACTDLWQDAPGMAPGRVTSMAVVDGAVYYATAGHGISRYDDSGWQQRTVPGEVLAGNQVRALAQDANGFVWIAGEHAVQQLHPLTPAITRLLPFKGATAPQPGERPSAENLPLDSVQVIAPDRVGGVWFGGLGVSFFDGDSWESYSTADGLAGSIVQAVALDLQRRVWIGTKTGLSIWNGEDFFNLTGENGLPDENVLALLAAGDAMWIGSNSGGLYRFQSNQVRIFNRDNSELPSNTVTALASGVDGSLLVGTNRGLVRFRDGTVDFFDDLPATEIRAVASRIDRNGGGPEEIWVATGGDGTFYFDGSGWTQWAVNRNQPSLEINALLLDSYDTLWIGGESGGISRLDAAR